MVILLQVGYCKKRQHDCIGESRRSQTHKPAQPEVWDFIRAFYPNLLDTFFAAEPFHFFLIKGLKIMVWTQMWKLFQSKYTFLTLGFLICVHCALSLVLSNSRGFSALI